MTLNYDCLRDTLIALERLLTIELIGESKYIHMPVVYIDDLMQDSEIRCYSKADVFYVIKNMEEAGYLSATIIDADECILECMVNDITYSGHMFLKSIHDETMWDTVKKKIGPVLNVSLPVLQEIASRVLLQNLFPGV